ncbi:MAG TPA: FHA domain-containing protein [Steroidobacteraceae bacterium]|nr:FHA domain-containing protein [Steroidobacteraceae bacterium]
MYTEWFKLQRLPFRLRPDPDFLYQAGAMGQILESLRAAVITGHGVACLTGEAGVGKTTLLHALAQQNFGSMTVARVQQPSVTPEELIEALATQFGLPPQEPAGREATARVTRFVAEENGHGRSVLILVDEAHRCSAGTLRELLVLAARHPAPFIVLAGESALLSTLAALEAQGVPVHLLASLQLPRLTAEQIEGYLDFRLHVAGSAGRTLFEADTMHEILRYTGGTPQLINVLCDNAMALAEVHNSPRVGTAEIRDAVQELKWVEFSARTPTAQLDPTGASKIAPVGRTVVMELEVQHSGRFVDRLTLKPGRLIVGRAEDAHIRLNSPFVSRQHCQIITTADQCFVEDMGSTNGILVNGRRRRVHCLMPQDRIVIGDHMLLYTESPAATP